MGKEEEYPLLSETEEGLESLKWRKKQPGGKIFCSELFFFPSSKLNCKLKAGVPLAHLRIPSECLEIALAVQLN